MYHAIAHSKEVYTRRLNSSTALTAQHSHLRLSGSTNRRTARRNQEITSRGLSIRTTSTLKTRRINALEARIRPRTRVPAVTRLLDTRRSNADLATGVRHSNVGVQRGLRAANVEPVVAVLPCRVARESQATRVTIVDEALLRVLESHAVLDDVIRRRVVRNAELETISVAVEVAEGPAVHAVAPCIHFFESDWRAEHEEVETVVDVIPETRVAENVTLAGAFFASEAIG